MTFTYQGKGALGESREGNVEAASRSEALRLLARDKIQPLRLVLRDEVSGVPVATKPARVDRPASGTVRLSQAQVILFTDELGELLHSGLQLEPALQLIEKREDKSPVKTVAALARQKVRDGVSFSEALKAISPDFGELYCNLVSAGEISGALTPLLRRQSAHLVALQDLRAKIKLALIYPACLVGFGTIAIVVLMTVLVPQMTSLLAKTGTAVPLPTYVLIHGANFMRHYTLIGAAILAALFVMFRAYIARPDRRVWWDQTKLRLPLVGPLLSASFYTEFCQGTANLLHHGLPLLSALKLMSRATRNTFYRTLVLKMSGLMAEGSSLTGAMKSVGHFPAALRDLVKIGEQTGELGGTMEKIGMRYEKLMQQRIDRVMAIVPVLVISGLGIVVGLVGWSIMSGIFQAIHGLQGHR
jgi:general secretion pathway protein F/type IV pilus assembly protein PilC